MTNKEILGKFTKGFVTGSSVSLLAFLQNQGCKVDDVNTFLYSAILGAASGGFHALWNMYFTEKL